MLLGVCWSCFSGQLLTWDNSWPWLSQEFLLCLLIIVLWHYSKCSQYSWIFGHVFFFNYIFSTHFCWPVENCGVCPACRWTQQRYGELFFFFHSCIFLWPLKFTSLCLYYLPLISHRSLKSSQLPTLNYCSEPKRCGGGCMGFRVNVLDLSPCSTPEGHDLEHIPQLSHCHNFNPFPNKGKHIHILVLSN